MSPERSSFKTTQQRDATDTSKLDSQKTHSTLDKPHEHGQIGPDGRPITGNVQFSDQVKAELVDKGNRLVADIIRGTQTPDTTLGPQEGPVSSASKKELFQTANGRSYEMFDPKTIQGPSLTAELEKTILRREGFSDDEVHEVASPSSDYNPLGYALFNRGAITSEEGKKVLDDNFVPESPVNPEQGRVFCYDPLTKTLTGGRIESMSADGKVTEIRRQWRDGGAIWKHRPDLLGEGWKTYREKTPWDKWDFVQVRGKARLEDAKEIFVGFQHSKDDHNEKVIRAVNSIAEKRNIIFLVEGYQAGEEVDRRDFPSIPKEVEIRGWDNMDLYNKGLELAEKEAELAERVEIAKKGSKQEYIDTSHQLESFQKSMNDIMFIQRNESLDKTLDETRQRFPGAIIIIDVWTKSNQKVGEVARGSVMG